MYIVRATYREKISPAVSPLPFAREWQFAEKEAALSFALVLNKGANSLITGVEIAESGCGCELEEHEFTCVRNFA